MLFLKQHIKPFNGEISKKFYELNVSTIQEAFDYIKQLPYGRNVNKSSWLTVLEEGKGTCSTKHALLKRLCTEQHIDDIQLFTRVFEMSGSYHPGVKKILQQHGLHAIPEAHVFLKIDGNIVDCTSTNSAFDAFIQSKNLHEEQITPEQTSDYKVDLQKKVMTEWLHQHQLTVPYSLEELWNIREQCIYALT